MALTIVPGGATPTEKASIKTPPTGAAAASTSDAPSTAAGCQEVADLGYNLWAVLGALEALVQDLREQPQDASRSVDAGLHEIGRVLRVARGMAHEIGAQAAELA